VLLDLLVAHAFGDYIFQTHEMATKKTSSHYWAVVHALVYTLAFWLFFPGASWLVLWGVSETHFLIDRYRLADT